MSLTISFSIRLLIKILSLKKKVNSKLQANVYQYNNA